MNRDGGFVGEGQIVSRKGILGSPPVLFREALGSDTELDHGSVRVGCVDRVTPPMVHFKNIAALVDPASLLFLQVLGARGTESHMIGP